MIEEQQILSYIRTARPELVEGFQRMIPAGRRGILHRLLQAIVRENIAGLGIRSRWTEAGNVLCLALSAGKTLRIPVARRHSMGRFDLGAGPVWLLSSTGQPVEIEHPAQLVDLLGDEGVAQDTAGRERLARFRHEMENSAANLALALAGAQVSGAKLAGQAAALGVSNSLAFAACQKAVDATFSPLAFFEQAVVEGHPLHPGAKIKMGLEVADVLRYSPEWGATPAVVLVAVRKDVCRYTSCADKTPSGLLYAEHPDLQERVEELLLKKGLRAAEYELIPVHPWQHDHTLPALYGAALARQEIVPLPEVRIPTQALMSFRSLAPVQSQGEWRHHIKTAVNIQTTGAVRTVSPNSAQNGPLLSRMLQTIQDREQGFARRFRILREEVGVYYRPSGGDDPVLGKNLAAILRENPERHLLAGELAMPGSAMLAVSPVSGKLIVAELIEAFAVTRGLTDLHAAGVGFLSEYAEVAVPGFLTLMSRYGIALEGHLQNSIAVFSEGVPSQMIVRDFGGVRILRERIARVGLQAEFYPGSATIIDDVHDMRNKIYYPVFQNHFGELILSIVRALGVEEKELWQPVADVCRRVWAELKQDAEIGQQAAEDEAALFASTLDLKAMATMRILGDVTSYTFAQVPNPLADVQSVERAPV
ncbi:IucA/IucC family protein [Tumebacillus permanentifrigoris]|uniref:Siderophore synthetase component n=1 Tax=Tumebacillus permanentifrigoris TaxID=378543 RepID=A0A316DEA2_9BACL|nr:IucA/IucC family protein [Tumebacillus permanentifrigoris]PWK15509.1 siderophore synthetase component [Tumebacillus permanentifrigoris]